MEVKTIDKNMKFDISLFPSEMEQTHPEFTKTSVRIMYPGFNRNNSFISEDAISDALSSLANIPVVGEFNEEKNNFTGHGGKVEITDEDIKFISTTVPYGVVPESAKISWETVTENDGSTHDYLVADGVLLWTGRYPELNTLIEEGGMGQSMEISVDTGNFAIIDGKETFKIEKFNFSALCILGIATEKNPDGLVEPCFESASISTYGLSDESFKQQFNFMLEEFNSNKTSKETGGQIVTKDKQELEFELTHQQLSAKLRKDLESHRFTDRHGYNGRKYWYQDHTNTDVIYEDLEEEGQLYKSPYTVNGDSVSIDLANRTAAKVEFVPEQKGADFQALESELEKAQTKLAEFEATLTAKDTEVEETVESLKAKHAEEFEALKAEYAQTVESMKADLSSLAEKSAEFEAISTEVEELRTFKRTTELAQVKEKFSSKLDEKSLDAILEASADKTLDVLESEIFAEIGKQNFSLIQDEKETKQPSINFSQKQQETYNGVYSALIAKHINK